MGRLAMCYVRVVGDWTALGDGSSRLIREEPGRHENVTLKNVSR